jgi:hypothetical protein
MVGPAIGRQGDAKAERAAREHRRAELVLRTYTGMTVTQCNMHAIHGFP